MARNRHTGSSKEVGRMSNLTALRARLAAMDKDLTSMEARRVATRQSAENATPGGLTGYDPAILSGVGHRGTKSDERRWSAYDREAQAEADLTRARRDRDILAARIERMERDAKAHRDLDSLTPGDLVRDSVGWHRVVRVNAKSVTVETGYSWT